jgi:uncharacterized membrane protein
MPLAPSIRSTATWRIASLDIIRGAVMILMAIDHVRVFSGLPAGGPTLGIFFTRWITHFVAPAFVFLAGTGAFLHGAKLENRGALSRFLFARGVWLVFLELTVLRFAWTFNFDYAHYSLAGVIWMIGWCMILMAALVRLPLTAIGAFGAAVIVGHNVMDLFAQSLVPVLRTSSLAWLWQVLYFGGPVRLGPDGPPLVVLYSIVPWVAVMAVGYVFGSVMLWPTEDRRRVCLQIGLGAIVLFVALRAIDAYGDPQPRHKLVPTFPPPLAFLATTKYPASLLFLLMTLGPTIALIPLLERARGATARVVATFGRVPLFYYVLHLPLIHVAAIAVSLVREGSVTPWLFTNHPVIPPPPPPGYAWGLPLLYFVWALVVITLYFPCRWFAALKNRRREAWLSYL